MQLGKAGNRAESHLQHFRTKTGTAHAQQEKIREALLLYGFDHRANILAVGILLFRDIKPAQPVSFVRAGPKGGVTLPQTANLSGCTPLIDTRLHRGSQGLGQLVSPLAHLGNHLRLRTLFHRLQQLVESLCE